MKTRIEIWVDTDLPTRDIEYLRKHLEELVWKEAKRILPQQGLMVQANEVPSPIPSSGSREDYTH